MEAQEIFNCLKMEFLWFFFFLVCIYRCLYMHINSSQLKSLFVFKFCLEHVELQQCDLS